MSGLSELFFRYLEKNAIQYGYDKDAGTTEKAVFFTDLEAAYPGSQFLTKNGGSWRRASDPLFKGYVVETKKNGGPGVVAIQLVGKKPPDTTRTIKSAIKNALKDKRCVVLACHPSTGCAVDHKDGRYTSFVANVDSQKENQFQPLHPVVNTAKREHCKSCTSSNKRFDARNLGYAIGWTYGAEPYRGSCTGCYWYDPKAFNEKSSAIGPEGATRQVPNEVTACDPLSRPQK